MSYSYSYKSSSNTGGSGMPGRVGNDAEFQAAKMQAKMGAPIGSTGGSSSYSYKSSSSNAGGPSMGPSGSMGNDAEFQAAKMQAMMGAPIGGTGGSSSYSYKSSSSNAGGPSMGPSGSMGNDAEFQAAKMQAMMGAPVGGTGGSGSYSYKSSSSSAGAPVMGVGGSGMAMDTEMERMKREMENKMPTNMGSSNGSYSYHTESNSGTNSATPRLIPLHEEGRSGSSGGASTVKKVVTTTTTKSNPQAVRELESIERDFSRIGRTPESYNDNFDKLKHEVLSGDAYKGETTTQHPVSTKVREEYTKTSKNIDSGATPRLIPVSVPSARSGGGVESTTTTTTRTYTSGSDGPLVTEEKVVKSSGGGLHSQPHTINAETFIPIKTYDNSFDDFHMNRWTDQKDHFGSLGAHDLDMQRMEWENRLGGIKSGFLPFRQQGMMGNTNSAVESSTTVSKNPLGKPEFSVQFEMRDFNPGDISISTRNGKLIIKALHEEKVGGSTHKKDFSRTVDLPADVQVNLMRSVYSRDGILSITAPIKPPQYNPRPAVTSYRSPPDYHIQKPQQAPSTWSSPYTKNHTTSTTSRQVTSSSNQAHSTTSSPRSLSRTSSASDSSSKPEAQKPSFSFNQNVVGYDPEDIQVTVIGRKVKVHAKHVESTPGGRRTHNEFTKMFDLPANYDTVECYIKDRHSLYITPSLRDDIEGSFVFIPIEKK